MRDITIVKLLFAILWSILIFEALFAPVVYSISIFPPSVYYVGRNDFLANPYILITGGYGWTWLIPYGVLALISFAIWMRIRPKGKPKAAPVSLQPIIASPSPISRPIDLVELEGRFKRWVEEGRELAASTSYLAKHVEDERAALAAMELLGVLIQSKGTPQPEEKAKPEPEPVQKPKPAPIPILTERVCKVPGCGTPVPPGMDLCLAHAFSAQGLTATTSSTPPTSTPAPEPKPEPEAKPTAEVAEEGPALTVLEKALLNLCPHTPAEMSAILAQQGRKRSMDRIVKSLHRLRECGYVTWTSPKLRYGGTVVQRIKPEGDEKA
jgi:hypothetical protein